MVFQHLQQLAVDVLSVCGASVLYYTGGCWRGSISKKDTSRLDKLIRRAGSVVGKKLDSLVMVAEMRTLDKLLDIIDQWFSTRGAWAQNKRVKTLTT